MAFLDTLTNKMAFGIDRFYFINLNITRIAIFIQMIGIE